MKPIIIQGAMEVEIQHYLDCLAPVTTEVVGHYRYHHCHIDGYPVVISQTNIGVANSAAATALAIEKYNPSLIVNQGVAGAHSPDLHVGDVVVGTGVRGINAFEKPLEKEGVHYKDWKEMNFDDDKGYLLSHPTLVALFDNAEFTSGQKIQGVLGSGDVWNREWEFIHWLHQSFGTLTEDMETLAMFKVAGQFDLPVVGVRIISNNELLEEGYAPETAEILQKFIMAQLPQLVAFAKGENKE